jgi:hypothetical protein
VCGGGSTCVVGGARVWWGEHVSEGRGRFVPIPRPDTKPPPHDVLGKAPIPRAPGMLRPRAAAPPPSAAGPATPARLPAAATPAARRGTARGQRGRSPYQRWRWRWWWPPAHASPRSVAPGMARGVGVSGWLRGCVGWVACGWRVAGGGWGGGCRKMGGGEVREAGGFCPLTQETVVCHAVPCCAHSSFRSFPSRAHRAVGCEEVIGEREMVPAHVGVAVWVAECSGQPVRAGHCEREGALRACSRLHADMVKAFQLKGATSSGSLSCRGAESGRGEGGEG